MDEWFTVDKIDDSTFAISEYKHWEETHCYLLLGTERAVLIDTGLGISNIKNIVDKLTPLPILVITTHIHWDHIGGHKHFHDIAVYEEEREWLENIFPIPLSVVISNLLCQPCHFPDGFHIDQYEIYQGTPTKLLYDGDIIDLGNRQIKVIHTPGHSPGHCCYYEPDRKYLYSGDLIYKGCLDAFYPTTDPQMFMQSVQKIKSLPMNKVLPSHHQMDIPVDLVYKIDSAFVELSNQKKLRQGNGIFDYKDFQIHI